MFFDEDGDGWVTNDAEDEVLEVKPYLQGNLVYVNSQGRRLVVPRTTGGFGKRYWVDESKSLHEFAELEVASRYLGAAVALPYASFQVSIGDLKSFSGSAGRDP